MCAKGADDIQKRAFQEKIRPVILSGMLNSSVIQEEQTDVDDIKHIYLELLNASKADATIRIQMACFCALMGDMQYANKVLEYILPNLDKKKEKISQDFTKTLRLLIAMDNDDLDYKILEKIAVKLSSFHKNAGASATLGAALVRVGKLADAQSILSTVWETAGSQKNTKEADYVGQMLGWLREKEREKQDSLASQNRATRKRACRPS